MSRKEDEGDELTSKEILKSYLLKSIYQLITKKQFHALLNKIAHHNVDDETVTWLLTIINDEIFKRHVAVVRSSIDNVEFVEDPESNIDDSRETVEMSSDELSKLIASMIELDQSVNHELKIYKQKSQTDIKDLKQLSKKIDLEEPSDMDNYDLNRLTDALENVRDYLTGKK